MYDITVEQKAALEAAGWRDEFRGWRKPAVRFAWCGDSRCWQATQSEPFQRIPLSDVLEFTAIMGIAPAGHVMVPVEVAERAAPLIQQALQQFAGLETWAAEWSALSTLDAALKR